MGADLTASPVTTRWRILLATILSGALLCAALTLPMLQITTSGEGLLKDLFSVAPDDLPITEREAFNLLAMMGVDLLEAHRTDRFSVLQGVRALWREGHLIPATLIALFSVLLPIIKVAMLGSAAIPLAQGVSAKIQRWLVEVNRWAMLDVFAVAVVLFVMTGSIGISASIGVGFVAFTVFVISYPLIARVVVRRVI